MWTNIFHREYKQKNCLHQSREDSHFKNPTSLPVHQWTYWLWCHRITACSHRVINRFALAASIRCCAMHLTRWMMTDTYERSKISQTAWTERVMRGGVWGAGWVTGTHHSAVHVHAADGISLPSDYRHSVVDLHDRWQAGCVWRIMKFSLTRNWFSYERLFRDSTRLVYILSDMLREQAQRQTYIHEYVVDVHTKTFLAWIFGIIEGKLIEILQPSRIPNFTFQSGTLGL